MTNKIFGSFARTAMAVAMLAGSQFAAAADVAAGSVVRLSDGVGSVAGIYEGSVISGLGKGGSFQSFCLEKYEYFTPGQDLYVKSVGTSTLNNQFSAASATNQNQTISKDPLSEATAWLFTHFYNNKATFASNVGLMDSFQKAIWYLEDELTKTEFFGFDTIAYKWVNGIKVQYTKHTKGAFEDAKAQQLVNDAMEATTLGADGKDLWDGLGNVRALNLFTKYDAKTDIYSGNSQDQLYMISAVPEVETYAMMLAGLGLMGTIARRRKNKSA